MPSNKVKQGSKLVMMIKSVVRTHMRRSAKGKVFKVRQYSDVRTKKKVEPKKPVSPKGKVILESKPSHYGKIRVTTNLDLSGAGIKQTGDGKHHARGLKTYAMTPAAFKKVAIKHNGGKATTPSAKPVEPKKTSHYEKMTEPKGLKEGLQNFVQMIINYGDKGDVRNVNLIATDLRNDLNPGGKFDPYKSVLDEGKAKAFKNQIQNIEDMSDIGDLAGAMKTLLKVKADLKAGVYDPKAKMTVSKPVGKLTDQFTRIVGGIEKEVKDSNKNLTPQALTSKVITKMKQRRNSAANDKAKAKWDEAIAIVGKRDVGKAPMMVIKNKVTPTKAAAKKVVKPKAKPSKTKKTKLLEMDGKTSGRILATKNIRIELKAAFPGQKFSVTSSSYSMGDSIDVRWNDGPTTKEVDKIIQKYQGGSFDGMIDLYTYSNDEFNNRHGDAKYVFSSRKVSVENELKVIAKLEKEYGHKIDHKIEEGYQGSKYVGYPNPDNKQVMGKWPDMFVHGEMSKMSFYKKPK